MKIEKYTPLMEIVKNNKNWEEMLQAEPYFITIKREGDLALAYYNQIFSDFSYRAVCESRGIIFDVKTFEVVCRPFDKFFNYGEKNACEMNWNEIRVNEKIDGSMFKLWFYNGVWNISTSKTIDAKNARVVDEVTFLYNSFYDVIMKGLEKAKLDFNKLDKLNTYIFEVVSPYTKVVVNYPEIDVYHLGTRVNKTGDEITVDIGVKKPMVYELNSIQDIQNFANTLDKDHEGFVVVDDKWNRVKVKSPLYVELHHLKNNGVITGARILEIIKNNEQDEVCAYFPELKARIDGMLEKVSSLVEKIEKDLDELDSKQFDTRKDLAMWAKTKPYSAVLFTYYDKKIEKNGLYGWILDQEEKTIDNMLK